MTKDYARLEEILADIDGLRRKGELVDTSAHARELAVVSLADRSRVLEILQSFACLSFDVQMPVSEGEKSVVSSYKDFNGLFEDHFYRKASIGPDKIKQAKLAALDQYQNALLQLPVAKSVFKMTAAKGVEDTFAVVSRTLLSIAVDSLKTKLSRPSPN